MVERALDKRIKRFCPKGHDTFLTGRVPSNGSCRLCANNARADQYKKNPERRIADIKRDLVRRKANPELYRRQSRDSCWKNAGILNTDGSRFTLVDFDRAYQIQQGRCLGCGLHQSEIKRSLHVDHNHKTGVFRFLLCVNCNKVLGHGQDNPAILRKLADLLETV